MEGEELGSRTSSSFAPAPRPEPEPARPPPPPSSSKHKGAPNQRQRFAVELRPGETTIVSWKRLVKDSRKSTHPPPAPDPPCGAHPALESRIAPAAGPGPTVEDEGRDALPPPNRFSAVIEKIERLYMGTQSSDEEELDDVPDEDDYDTEDSFIDDAELKSKSTLTKEGSSVRPKGTLLERAIQDLETTVAESRPPTIEVQEADGSSQGVKRRLPPEVKQKLAKVARLAQSSQGIISEELINRLMSILGHVVQLKTLKRNLKKMVELGLSAEQEKDDRFRQLKKDVVEMIRIQTSFLRSKVSFGSMQEYLQYALSPQLRICLSQMKAAIQQDGSSDDFQDVHHGSDEKGRYGMDDAMEDKICDLYDLYVEGMDEDKGPHIRKLYVELAELWPSGTMDKCGIKCAINRAKVRKRLLYSRLKEEKMKRKKISAAAKMEETTRGEGNVNAQPRPAQERLATDSSRAFMPNDKPTSSLHLPTSGKTSNPPLNASSLDRPRQEKVRVSINMVDEASNGKTTDVAVLKKKVKRKPESNLGENNFRPVKLPPPLQLHGEERHKSHKLAPNHHHKSSHQSAILQHCEQPS
ncbi:ubinuclein-1-like isoform X5 [Magnolia sinica]|uniref:ubinuclein-1-like isoform X5 n=1 Tax=Magnolia sinica TaxID=86752 RepID=UPI00265AFFA7|nr:ubinuclein-1-like isoform X5 [Magnolia sinica]